LQLISLSVLLGASLFLPFACLAKSESQMDVEKGWAFVNARHHQRAIPFFDHAIKLDPNNVFAYLSRGGAYVDLEEYDKALADLNKVIKMEPSNYIAYQRRAEVYYETKRLQDAIDDYTKLIELRATVPPNTTAEVYRSRGKIYAQMGNPDKALADFSSGIAVFPKDRFNYCERATLYSAQGQYQKAIDDCTTAIKLADAVKQDSLSIHSTRAKLYEKIGRNDLAAKDKKVVEHVVNSFEDQ